MSEWIPIKKRKITKEEIEEMEDAGLFVDPECEIIFDCRMPEDGQDILITLQAPSGERFVAADVCVRDNYYCGLELNDDFNYVVAWMPMPEPYKEEK